MTQRYSFGLFGAPIAAMLLLAGCGNGGDSQTQASAPAPAASSQASASKVEAAQHVGQFAEDGTLSSLAGLKTISVCSLENVVSTSDGAQNPGDAPNSFKVKKGASYKFIGFATDVAQARVPAKIKLVLSGGAKNFSRSTETGGSRPDVAAYFKQPALANAGYQLDAVFDQVPAGTYEVVVVDAEANAACPTHQTLVVE
jgi:hypothetical protein